MPIEAQVAPGGRLGASLGSSWELLVGFWAHLGASWTPLGRLLGPFGSLLGDSWGFETPQDAPRRTQDAPRGPPDGPMGPQDAPKTHQEAPKTALQAPKTCPKPPQGSPNKDTHQQIKMHSEVGVVSAVGAAVDIVVGACQGQMPNSPAYLRKDTTYDTNTNHEINQKNIPI